MSTTQRDTGLQILRTLFKTLDAQQSLVTALRAVVDDAQNGPPDGPGDGSIPEVLWTDMRDLTCHLDRAQDTMEKMRSYLVNPPAL